MGRQRRSKATVAGGADLARFAMCAAGAGKKSKRMKTLEVRLVGHEGIHRLGFAHILNSGMYAPPAGGNSVGTFLAKG